ncbi:MAG: DNA polymerase III subunit delta [Planctomycetia bacterium]|jgi:DNA polymerase-3 subunit delta
MAKKATQSKSSSKAVDAVSYLSAPEKHPAKPVCAVFGEDAFLQRHVMERLRSEVVGDADGEYAFFAFDGRKAQLSEVLEELTTISMFGGGRRLVLVDDADDFIKRYRPELEEYADQPGETGVLVLQPRSFASNTRLYKALATAGLLVDCEVPSSGKLLKWLVNWAKKVHHISISDAAARLLIELAGEEPGLLDQELAKLASAAGEEATVTPELIREMVGSWRAKTTWDMLDAALDGQPQEAITQLDRLLLSGETPIAILGQISASLRRFAAATRIILQTEQAGRRPALNAALEEAGVQPYFIQKTQQQLRKLGRHRGAKLYQRLLDADLALKGASALPPRLVMEELLTWLAAGEMRT